jgi:HSP20 family protein
MANAASDLQERESQLPEPERTRASRVYVPRVDIWETEDAILVAADMPGADENSVDVTVEKNVLSINGKVERERPEGHSILLSEYDVGDYQRVFTLPNEIDQERIQASVRNGVLRLTLHKARAAKPKKIEVSSGEAARPAMSIL